VSPNKGLRNAGRRRCGPLRLVLCEARWPPCSNPDHAHPKNDGYDCQLQGSLLARRTKAAGSGGSNQSWLVYAGRGPQPYIMQVGSRHRLGGRNRQWARQGSRCRPNNLREGAMVPLHGTCLLEVRAASLGRQDSGGLIYFAEGDDGSRGSARFLKICPFQTGQLRSAAVS
jgi:hypothetical protein